MKKLICFLTAATLVAFMASCEPKKSGEDDLSEKTSQNAETQQSQESGTTNGGDTTEPWGETTDTTQEGVGDNWTKFY